MAKTVIREIDARTVNIAFEDEMGDRIEMHIWAPMPKAGGSSYVRFRSHDGIERQLCERLSSRGSTLMYSDGTRLVDLVRREYRAMRAAEKRAAERLPY